MVCGGMPMSVMGCVFDTQMMHAAWLYLCSQTELGYVPFGKKSKKLCGSEKVLVAR
jgi:hypothetical protein